NQEQKQGEYSGEFTSMGKYPPPAGCRVYVHGMVFQCHNGMSRQSEYRKILGIYRYQAGGMRPRNTSYRPSCIGRIVLTILLTVHQVTCAGIKSWYIPS